MLDEQSAKAGNSGESFQAQQPMSQTQLPRRSFMKRLGWGAAAAGCKTMKRIRLALFEDRMHAEPTRQRLAQAGIRAEVHAETSFAQLWFVSRRRAGMCVEVASDQARWAAQLLEQWDGHEGWSSYAIRCPECKSFHVDFPQFTEKSILTNLSMGLIAELGFIERQYYCEDCHCMWGRPGGRSIRIRSHLSPNYFLEDI
jgi:hypothetical protein